ncbi:MAG TPA: hypothetical protein VET24_05760 [Actinomycetota bacterium]|nr:hypothetical protein [Actinomycetota bacterium]
MRRATMLLLGLALAGCSATPGHVGQGGAVSTPAPDEGAGMAPASTPGATNPAVTQDSIHQSICVQGWTATVRPPASYTDRLKAQQMAALGLTGPASAYEEDHRVPLEAGGSPTSAMNLWPEPWDGPRGAHRKDAIENRVHAAICAGRMTLAQGQAVFQGDWWTAVVP